MNLSNLRPPAGQKKERKRIGRGMGSGHGKAAFARRHARSAGRRRQGHHRGPRILARPQSRGRNARSGSGETLMAGTIKIKLVRSPICTPDKHKRVVKGLGLRKLNQIVVRPDSPVFRGMVKKVPHLLEVVD